MTEPYKTIFLQWGHRSDWDSLTWCQDRIDDDDVEYVRKDLYDELRVELKTVKAELTTRKLPPYVGPYE